MLERASRWKVAGYANTGIGVVLVAIPGWESAKNSPAMAFLLIAGSILALVGIVLRWNSHKIEHHL